MFCVLFEVHPRPERFEAYLGYAKRLRPQLEGMDGFIENIRYRSLARDGWILSLSTWRDEKSLVRWRIQADHHAVQEKGRDEVFLDYHLRIGEMTRDTRLADCDVPSAQRLDETATGAGTTVLLMDASEVPGKAEALETRVRVLGLDVAAAGLVDYDAFEAVLTPGDFIAMSTWRDEASARAFEAAAPVPANVRWRRVRIVRDYGMFDRREAPQYYPEVVRTPKA